MRVEAAERAWPRQAMKAGLVSGGVFLLVFIVLSLFLLNLANPWIESAAPVRSAATRLLLLLVPVLVIDAIAALVGALAGGRVALGGGCSGRTVTFVSIIPPVVVALALAAAGASSAAQVVYDLLAVGAGGWAGALIALRGEREAFSAA